MKIDKETFFEVVRFAIVGIGATVVHYGIYLALHHIIDASVAFAVGYFVSFLFNYVLSARFTFKKSTTVRNGVGFCLAHAFNFVLQLSLLNLFLWLGVEKSLAPLPVYCIAVPVNFLMVRYVFTRTRK